MGSFFSDFGTAFETERSQPYVLGSYQVGCNVYYSGRSVPDESSLKRPTVVSTQGSSPDELTCKAQTLYSVPLTYLVQTQSTSTRFEMSQKSVRLRI